MIAITLWDSLREAQAGVAAAWEWVRENMSDELEWTETEFVDVLLSTSFGVSPSWEDPNSLRLLAVPPEERVRLVGSANGDRAALGNEKGPPLAGLSQ